MTIPGECVRDRFCVLSRVLAFFGKRLEIFLCMWYNYIVELSAVNAALIRKIQKMEVGL